MSELLAPNPDEVLAGVAEAVIAHDREGRLVYANPEARGLDGLPPLAELAGAHDGESTWRLHERSTGEPRFYVARTRASAGLTVTTLYDFTERQEAADLQRVVAEAGRVLASSLDYQVTL